MQRRLLGLQRGHARLQCLLLALARSQPLGQALLRVQPAAFLRRWGRLGGLHGARARIGGSGRIGAPPGHCFAPLARHLLQMALVAVQISVEGVQPPLSHHPEGVADAAQQRAVVADQQHRTVEAGQRQCLARGQVEVVGRLIQQQQVAGAHPRAGQLQPHAPAAGKGSDRLLPLRRRKAQPQLQRLRTRWRVMGACVGQHGVRLGDRRASPSGFSRGQRRAGLDQARLAVQHEGRGRLRSAGHVLRHVGHTPIAGVLQFAGVLMQLAEQQRKQAGFAGTVAAHQPNLFAGVQRDAGAVQHHFGAAAQRDVAQDDHGALRLGSGGRSARAASSAARVMSSTASGPALVCSHSTARVGNAASKCARSWPISSTSTASSSI